MVAFYFNEFNANKKFQIPPSVSTKTYMAAPLSSVFADHREQSSISLYLLVPRLLKAAPTPCCSRPAFSDLPMSQVFARAVPDASKPFLPLFTSLVLLSSQLSAESSFPLEVWVPTLWGDALRAWYPSPSNTYLSFAPLHVFVRLFNHRLSQKTLSGQGQH